MASKLKKTKKQRKPKTSKGIHGGGGKVHGFSEVDKVLLGKGMMHRVDKRWRTPVSN
jgi:hypothetical protein